MEAMFTIGNWSPIEVLFPIGNWSQMEAMFSIGNWSPIDVLFTISNWLPIVNRTSIGDHLLTGWDSDQSHVGEWQPTNWVLLFIFIFCFYSLNIFYGHPIYCARTQTIVIYCTDTTAWTRLNDHNHCVYCMCSWLYYITVTTPLLHN